jgi:hypothetical protein
VSKPAEFGRDALGPGSVRAIIEDAAIGKTVASIWFGLDPADCKTVHNGERLVFRFTDGSALELQLGSNLWNLHSDRVLGKTLPRDVSLSFIALSRKSNG